jgi:hypothetical protein
MKLKNFDSPQDVLAYVFAELHSSLGDDLGRMENEERDFYSADERRDMRNRMADIAAIEDSTLTTGDLRLWYVRASTEDGESADLMVWAKTQKQAIAIWRAYVRQAGWGKVEREPTWCGPVPLKPVEGAISWNEIHGAADATA